MNNENAKPLVSIIVPVYNVAHYLSACLESLLAQTYTAIEILCIDDASTDVSREILRQYEGAHENIHVLWNAVNQGLSYTRNRGIRAAGGRYLCFVDSDDALEPQAIAHLVKEADAGQTDLVFFDYGQIDGDGKRDATAAKHFLYQAFPEHEVMSGQDMFLLMIEKLEAVRSPGCGQFVRTGFLREKHLAFEEGLLHEDVMFTTKTLLLAERVSVLNEKLYLYRRYSEPTISTSANPLRAQSIFYSFSYFWILWHQMAPLWTAKMNRGFAKHLKNIFQLYLSCRPFAEQQAPFRYGNIADNFLFDLFEKCEMTIENHLIFAEEDRAILRTAKHVFVYGAGVFGVEAVSQIHGMGVAVSGVVVSSLAGNPKSLQGVPVSLYHRSSFQDRDVLIFAIRPEAAGELLVKLEKELPCAIVKPKVRM